MIKVECKQTNELNDCDICNYQSQTIYTVTIGDKVIKLDESCVIELEKKLWNARH